MMDKTKSCAMMIPDPINIRSKRNCLYPRAKGSDICTKHMRMAKKKKYELAKTVAMASSDVANFAARKMERYRVIINDLLNQIAMIDNELGSGQEGITKEQVAMVRKWIDFPEDWELNDRSGDWEELDEKN